MQDFGNFKLSLMQEINRLSTGQGKVREICFFFKVREKSGNSVKWSGKLKILKSQHKVREFYFRLRVGTLFTLNSWVLMFYLTTNTIVTALCCQDGLCLCLLTMLTKASRIKCAKLR